MLKLAVAASLASLAVLAWGCSGSSNGTFGDAGTSSGGASSAGNSSGGSKSGGGSSSNGGAVSAGAPNWELWSACSTTEECIVIPIASCCGCAATGVNTMYEAQARASDANFNAAACGPVGCANFPCPPDAMVACEMGRCVPKPGCSERDELSCDADDKCEKYSARLCTTPGELAYFTCGKPKGACDDALTCRVSPAGQQVLFADSCVPDGYTQECPSQCQ